MTLIASLFSVQAHIPGIPEISEAQCSSGLSYFASGSSMPKASSSSFSRVLGYRVASNSAPPCPASLLTGNASLQASNKQQAGHAGLKSRRRSYLPGTHLGSESLPTGGFSKYLPQVSLNAYTFRGSSCGSAATKKGFPLLVIVCVILDCP
jgi:hypothetical protein